MNLLVFEGKLHQGVSYDRFKNQFDDLLNTFKKDLPNLQKMEMLKNKAETYFLFNNYSILNIAQNFSFWNYCDVRKEDILDRLQNLDAEKIKNISQSIFQKHNEIEIVYIPEIV
jgi:predicted Zn-dependent peptidase